MTALRTIEETIESALDTLPDDCRKWGIHEWRPAIKDKSDYFGWDADKWPIYRCRLCAARTDNPNVRT